MTWTELLKSQRRQKIRQIWILTRIVQNWRGAKGPELEHLMRAVVMKTNPYKARNCPALPNSVFLRACIQHQTIIIQKVLYCLKLWRFWKWNKIFSELQISPRASSSHHSFSSLPASDSAVPGEFYPKYLFLYF